MKFTEEKARELVERWSTSCKIAWSAQEQNEVGAVLVRLADVVTPHVVRDANLSDSRVLEILARRTLNVIEEVLLKTAVPLRQAYDLDGVRFQQDGAHHAVGLRSATRDELVDLPGLGEKSAAQLAHYLSSRPVSIIEEIVEIDGFGAKRLALLRKSAYLDPPTRMLLSPTVYRFVINPTISSFLSVLENSDLGFAFGDETAFVRRMPQWQASVASRFCALLNTIFEHRSRIATIADGIVASEAEQWLRRYEKYLGYLERLTEARGIVLRDSQYYEGAHKILTEATQELSLMVFLATAASGSADRPGPLGLIEALEAAAARGVRVRVILDRDDPSKPYKSYLINKSLATRLRSGNVDVRFDAQDTLLHSKVLVADRRVVVVGSHNWTYAGMNATHDLSLVLQSEVIATDFANKFESLWSSLPPLGK